MFSRDALVQNLGKLYGGLIVSCQADVGEPLSSPEHIAALALSVVYGGAKGLRLEGAENVTKVKQHLSTKIPVIGLTKAQEIPYGERLRRVYITPSFEDAQAIADAGAEIIALDATGRLRKDGLSLKETIDLIHNELKKPVWADVATCAEGVLAAELGADIISTTLFGYTEETIVPADHGPALCLLAELKRYILTPVVLEGRVWYPDEVRQAFDSGAHAVVVGSAITRPKLITERFVRATPTYMKNEPI